MRKTIPLQIVTTCDACGETMTKDNARLQGSVRVMRAGVDLQGHAVGARTRNYDACDRCLDMVDKALDFLEPKS